MTTAAARFRRLLAEPDMIVLPGAFDALSARLIEQAGFSALVMGGYSIAASRLGQPDVGYLGMSEMAAAVKTVADAVAIPVLADGDTGYGNALSVIRTVREYERMGAAGIILEDQVWPKRCGHMQGKAVIPTEEHAGKIAAACDARRDPDFVVVARTDARADLGLEVALERARQYRTAGADVLFIEAPQNLGELALIGQAFPEVPLLANMVEGGATPLLTAAELKELGFKLVLFACTPIYTAAAALRSVLAHIHRTGSSRDYPGLHMEFADFNQMIGLPDFRELEARYRAGLAVKAN